MDRILYGFEEMPQGLKPKRFAAFCGTAEAVPFQSFRVLRSFLTKL
jgi:predicted glycosyltransferase